MITTKINRIKIVEYNTWSLTEHERAIFLGEMFNILSSIEEDCLEEDFVCKLEENLNRILNSKKVMKTDESKE